jgi:hypothetical protein
MRRYGQRQLPAVVAEDGVEGAVLAIDRYGGGETFYIRFHRPGNFTDWTFELHGARLVKRSGAVMQIAGDEFAYDRGQHFRQSWLCTPTRDRGLEILRTMAAREEDR